MKHGSALLKKRIFCAPARVSANGPVADTRFPAGLDAQCNAELMEALAANKAAL